LGKRGFCSGAISLAKAYPQLTKVKWEKENTYQEAGFKLMIPGIPFYRMM